MGPDEDGQAGSTLVTEGADRLHAALSDGIPGCVAFAVRKHTREILMANRLARETGIVPGLLCHEAFAGRSEPCEFCQAPLLWETGETQRIEVEHRGAWCECIWGDATDDAFVHYILDIAERKRSEAGLRLLEFAISQVSDMAAWADSTGRFTYVGESMCTRLGYTREELLGHPVWEFDASVPGGWDEHWRRLKSEKAATFDSVYRAKNGQMIPVEVAANYIVHEGKEYSLGIVRDLSERRRTERDRQIMSHAVEHAGLGLIRLDKQGGIREVNGYVCRLLGYSRDELLGMTAFDLTIGLDPAEWPERWARLVGLGPVTFEKEYRTKSGDIIPVEISSSIVDFEGEELDHGFIRDIRDQKAAEEAIRQRDEQLLQAQKMEAIGRLAGGIAHDFNNLLMAIIGYSDLVLCDESVASLPAVEDVREIKRAAERAAALTQQILAFSRRQRLNPEVVSANSLVEESLPLLRRTIGEDVHLRVTLEPRLALTEIDPNQFCQVIMNLAVNARDAMPGGGTMSIETANVSLAEGPETAGLDLPAGDYVRLSVSDTGTGMSPEEIPLIFEPFYTTKPTGKGTGLGLPTAQGVIKQSGGAIAVESVAGQGTTFHVYLPRVHSESLPEAGPVPGEGSAQEPAPDARLDSGRILVVEDESGVRKLVERLLTAKGYTVVSAGDGKEALEMLAFSDVPPDLLITDLVLPGGLDGAAIAEAARTAVPGLPVLFMSGYPRDAHLGTRSGLQDLPYLKKPFAPDELYAQVREALGAD